REDHVHARPVRQPCVAQRLRLVHAPSQRRQDPLDRIAQVLLAREPHGGLLQPPAPLHPHRRDAADHDLVDARIAQQRLQRPARPPPAPPTPPGGPWGRAPPAARPTPGLGAGGPAPAPPPPASRRSRSSTARASRASMPPLGLRGANSPLRPW